MQSIAQIQIQNKRVLVRVDFNVPLNASFEVTDTTRIRAAVPTLKHILNQGGSIVLMSHLGRPRNGPEEKYSLRHLIPVLENELGVNVEFAGDCISETAFAKTSHLNSGQVVLLENLRFYKEEEKGQLEFAQLLCRHGDIYINDAFGTAHRSHASTAVMAQFYKDTCKAMGFLMQREVEQITKVMHHAQAPFTAIIGGAKVSDKILVIQQLLSRAQHIIIGGGMAYTFFKAQSNIDWLEIFNN